MISLVLHTVGVVVLLTWFAIWFLDQLVAPRVLINAWRTRDGRWLVQYTDDETEHYAIGCGDEWVACDAEPPSRVWPLGTITDEGTLRYLRSRWAHAEQLRRAREQRRARRARKWAKQKIGASEAGSGGSSLAPQTEPRVLSSSWDGSSTS